MKLEMLIFRSCGGMTPTADGNMPRFHPLILILLCQTSVWEIFSGEEASVKKYHTSRYYAKMGSSMEHYKYYQYQVYHTYDWWE